MTGLKYKNASILLQCYGILMTVCIYGFSLTFQFYYTYVYACIYFTFYCIIVFTSSLLPFEQYEIGTDKIFCYSLVSSSYFYILRE